MLPMLRLNGGHRSRNKKKSLKPHIPTVDPLPNRPEKIIILSNEAFSDYYSQQLALDSDQFQLFMASLKMPLPVSFRFTGSRDYADDLKDFMVKHIFPKVAVSVDGLLIKPPQMIDWYPNGLCYQFDCSRQILRRSVEAKQFQSFLVHETQVGNISRQELVSMIPVLLLDVMPGHAVFDSCASPGSKTAQIIEALTPSGNGIPEGLVIANDSSQPRCYTLVHQAKRLQSPCLMVTNHDAQIFPRIPIISQSGAKKSILQFDRVLCDVPCSGDGTLRKNVGIWKNFAVGNGNALHRIQKQILKRGVELCKVGGRIVYSTCTLNPIENEAVVASILKESNGALKLLNVSDSLPTLLRKPGLTTWKVSNKNGKMFDEQPNKDCFIDSMFPPENIGDLGMEKCIRIYPHLQNTGGFFVAVIEKVGAFGSIDRVNSFYEKNNDDNIEEGLVDDDEVSELSEMVVDVNDQDESQQ
jgi:16S rRNA C967 or C1407 C5-methylase (RsmB/RsmF family)